VFSEPPPGDANATDAQRVRENHRREHRVSQEELLRGQRHRNGHQVLHVADDAGTAQTVAARQSRIRLPVRLEEARVESQPAPSGHVAVPSVVPESECTGYMSTGRHVYRATTEQTPRSTNRRVRVFVTGGTLFYSASVLFRYKIRTDRTPGGRFRNRSSRPPIGRVVTRTSPRRVLNDRRRPPLTRPTTRRSKIEKRRTTNAI